MRKVYNAHLNFMKKERKEHPFTHAAQAFDQRDYAKTLAEHGIVLIVNGVLKNGMVPRYWWRGARDEDDIEMRYL